jgi:hypothetical protein
MKIDFGKLQHQLLPSLLRGAALLNALVGAVMQCLSNIYAMVMQYIDRERRERGYNCQVINLRRAVADLLGIDIAEVRIEDAPNQEYLYVYADKMQHNVVLTKVPTVIYSDRSVRYTRMFYVYIPTECKDRENEVRAILDRYKMVTTVYNIYWI